MSSDSVIAILAGGLGTRLWPLSSPDRPKQFLPLFSGRSMLQKAFERAAGIVGYDSVMIVGNARHETLYRDQLPHLAPENLVLEPFGRGTAAAVSLAALICADRRPGSVVATIPSDHVIPDPDNWISAVLTGLAFADREDQIVCLGTTPYPGETKFGYMIAGDRLGGDHGNPVKRVARFVEKPDSGALDALISTGNCYRNMGTLMFRPEVLIREMRLFLPEVINPLAHTLEGEVGVVADAYAEIPARSIDESVLQRSSHVAAAVGDIKSIDAGDFASLGDAIGRDGHGNASVGKVVTVDADGNTVFAGDTSVALVGVSDLVVVVDGDRILVCPAGQTQRIRDIQKED